MGVSEPAAARGAGMVFTPLAPRPPAPRPRPARFHARKHRLSVSQIVYNISKIMSKVAELLDMNVLHLNDLRMMNGEYFGKKTNPNGLRTRNELSAMNLPARLQKENRPMEGVRTLGRVSWAG